MHGSGGVFDASFIYRHGDLDFRSGNHADIDTCISESLKHRCSITNDANLWATETMGNPKYPLELLLRVITVSLETMKVVNGLPKLEIH